MVKINKKYSLISLILEERQEDAGDLKTKIKLQRTALKEHENWLLTLLNILNNSNNKDYTKPIQKV